MSIINLQSTSDKLPYEEIYRAVFRASFDLAGFACIEFEKADTYSLRESMVRLKLEFDKRHSERTNRKICYHWLGRFDQQESTLFHRDNAGDSSCLMLGYEPSEIESELFIADHSKFDFDNEGEDGLETILNESREVASKYDRYLTGIRFSSAPNHRIVIINNSIISAECPGVLHKANVLEKDPAKPRIINSVMLNVVPKSEDERFDQTQVAEFTTTDRVS